MLATQVKHWLQRQTPITILRRVGILLLFTIAFSAVLNRPNDSATPAGFGRGVLDGALMPGAMPPLLMGRNVTIYAQNNTGRTYKLGYTVGVNGCGALFFGIVFWRERRWKNSFSKKTVAAHPL